VAVSGGATVESSPQPATTMTEHTASISK
jgi:hypothetical protein